jgi:hypothetical protein
MESTDGHSKEEVARFGAILAERKRRLLDEIRQVLVRVARTRKGSRAAHA